MATATQQIRIKRESIMDIPKPKRAADHPLAASLLGAVLVKHGRENQEPSQEQAGTDLLKIAEANQDKMPRLDANSPLVNASKKAGE